MNRLKSAIRSGMLTALSALLSLVYGQLQTGKSGGPNFFVDAASFASRDSTKGRLEVFLKIAHGELVFVKESASRFRASYEIVYEIRNKANQLIERVFDDRSILLNNYAETVMDSRFHFSRKTFNLPPGQYDLSVTITDRETGYFGQRKMDTPVRLFRDKPIAISDLIFADKIQRDSGNTVVNIVPNVFRSYDSADDSCQVYFEIYNSRFAGMTHETQAAPDSEVVMVYYRVLDKNQNVVLADSFPSVVREYQTFSFLRLERTRLSYGRYILDVAIQRGKDRASTRSVFDIRAANFTNWSTSGQFDLDLAIKQMVHIARSVNLSKILKATKEEKEKFFREFWKKRDPTPDTERNELMEEYYRRVQYANRYFTSGYREGWDTDRGMVYIIMDSPDGVERHPFEVNTKPYEIWYYYEANLKLFFIDNYGFGDYELHPSSRMEFENYVFQRRR